jgi:hypothetical protein
MNANFGLLDPLPGKVKKDRKKELLVERAQADFIAWVQQAGTISGSGAMAEAHHRGTESLPREERGDTKVSLA